MNYGKGLDCTPIALVEHHAVDSTNSFDCTSILRKNILTLLRKVTNAACRERCQLIMHRGQNINLYVIVGQEMSGHGSLVVKVMDSWLVQA
ncbi:hypothetical protein TNCV_2927871 [Trichonephila clavipes]|nr:hypothetical protein TNCV_2927871 [Trichonephila clavipes]